MDTTDYITFTEWYHYAILFLWLILLLTGIKYFSLLESNFKTKNDFGNGEKYGKTFLISSFIIGLFLVLIFTFKPAQISAQSELNWDYAKYILYGFFIIMVAVNAFVSIKNYESRSGVIRLIIMTILMLLYFYTGMLGGLLVIAIFVLFILIYAIIKFKNILTIK